MLLTILSSNPTITTDEIAEFAKRHKLDITQSYVKFMLQNNGGQPTPTAFPIYGFENNPVGTVQSFFGLHAAINTEDLGVIMDNLNNKIPQGILPIACTDSYDFVCIDHRQNRCPVVFWDRAGFWGSEQWNELDLYPVAADFDSFIESLHQFRLEDFTKMSE